MKFTIDTKDYVGRILGAVGLTTNTASKAKASRAYEAGYSDSGNDEPPSGDINTFGYRRVTARNLRDFSKISNDKLIEIAWTLAQSNPLAMRALGLKRDFVLGRGVVVKADNDKQQGVIDTFWERHQVGPFLKKYVVQKRLFGTQCLPVFVRESDGQVSYGYIDPAAVDYIVPHPHNVLKPWAVVLKKDVAGSIKILKIIREDEGHVADGQVVQPRYEGKLTTAKQTDLAPWEQAFLQANSLSEYSGDCFLFTSGNLSNQLMGVSDLLQSADFLDAQDNVLFALADREEMAGFFMFDVKLDEADDARVSERAKEIRDNQPKRGSVNVHNNAEEWTIPTPDLKQAGSVATSNALQEHIAAGQGFPNHWFADGSKTNRSTAEAQHDPTFRMLETIQDDIQDDIEFIVEFVSDQAEIAGTLTAEENSIFLVIMPDMTPKNAAVLVPALESMAKSLTVIKTLNLITPETMAKAIAKLFGEMGIEYNALEELKLAQAATVLVEPVATVEEAHTNGFDKSLNLPTVTQWRLSGMSDPEIQQALADARLEDDYGIVEPFGVRQ